jgi:hypothetical protein
MSMKKMMYLALSFLALLAWGCGGGGSSSSDGGTAVNGVATKGPISGGKVQVFEIFSSSVPSKARIGSTVIAEGTTDATGKFNLTIPSNIKSGGLLFKLTGGTYTDEATGTTGVKVADQAPNGLRAVFSNISGAVRRGGTISVNITPFTEMGVQALGSSTPSDENIAAANARVTSTLGLTGVDITGTTPFDATATPPAGVTQAQIDYSLALATFSQIQNDKGLTVEGVVNQLMPDILNGTLSAADQATADASMMNFYNSGKNKSGTTLPVAVTVAPSKTTAVTSGGDSVTITADVTLDGQPAPDGAEVKFAVKSGTATLSAASAVTSGGSASVTLNSATAGAVVVTATAGGVSADSAAINFISQPTVATVTIATSGTLPSGTNIGGINATLNYSTSVVSQLTDADVNMTGPGLGSGTLPVMNTNPTGQVIFGLINYGSGSNVIDTTGDFATLTFHIIAGNFPANAADLGLTLSNITVIDTNGQAIPGVTVSVSGVTVQ